MLLADAASFPIWLNILIFLAAAAVIWHGGTRLTHELDAIAERTGLDHAFVGMLLLGGITSLPELANVITASSLGNPSLAINNLLGSAAINVLLLAVADAIVGRKAVTALVARPSTMMMGVLCMIILALIGAIVMTGDVAVGPVGGGAVTIGFASIFAFWIATGHDERSPWSVDDDDKAGSKSEDSDQSAKGRWWAVVLFGALIFASGYALSQVGDAMAEQFGITSAVVGFALIGTATSLPELVTILAALKLGRPEMAFGQVLGTNFVNLSMIPLADAVYVGDPVLTTLGDFEAISALLGLILIGFFMVGLLEHRNRTIGRMGLDSAAVIGGFAAGAVVLSLL